MRTNLHEETEVSFNSLSEKVLVSNEQTKENKGKIQLNPSNLDVKEELRSEQWESLSEAVIIMNKYIKFYSFKVRFKNNFTCKSNLIPNKLNFSTFL